MDTTIKPHIKRHIANYLSYLTSACHITRVPRSDLQGKKIFEIREKYYFEDLGFRNVLIGYRPQDINKLFEFPPSYRKLLRCHKAIA
jgi:predicted AAA+ superfamily ATPase